MTTPDDARPDHDPSEPDDEGLRPANPGPVPAEAEDVPDAGDGQLGPQPGNPRLSPEDADRG